jgi:hypothetical protein
MTSEPTGIVCGPLQYPPGVNDDLKGLTHGKRGHHCTMYCEEWTDDDK